MIIIGSRVAVSSSLTDATVRVHNMTASSDRGGLGDLGCPEPGLVVVPPCAGPGAVAGAGNVRSPVSMSRAARQTSAVTRS